MIRYNYILFKDHLRTARLNTLPDVNDFADYCYFSGGSVPCLPRHSVDFSDSLVWLSSNNRFCPLLF